MRESAKPMRKKVAKKAAAKIGKVAIPRPLPCKIGKIWIHDLSDVLQEYLDVLKIWSADHEGVSYMPVGTQIDGLGNYIVLEHRKKHRHRYIGWFCVWDHQMGNTHAWTFKAKKCGFYIHQITDDDKPGGPRSIAVPRQGTKS